MPAQDNISYRRPSRFLSTHFETIYPALFRKVKDLVPHERERLELVDGDFLDLDWRKQGTKKLLIVQHGLEGSSDRPYVLGMAKHFYLNGYDTLNWNFRGCSGEMNRLVRFYHSGATEDLDAVVQRALKDYDHISLIGFSLGGNMTLKYLGEREPDERVKCGVAISTPLDLASGADNLHSTRARIYEMRFLRSLKRKVMEKSRQMPDKIDLSGLPKVKTIRQFDDFFTSRLHGFKDANDYYNKCSSRNFLTGITRPTLIINAKNDPFLTPECLDHSLTRELSNVHLETTTYGGHVGFVTLGQDNVYWSEERALEFCQQF
ncbi:MAG: alpha/beta fold hydrolase [Marinoscillum sp.]